MSDLQAFGSHATHAVSAPVGSVVMYAGPVEDHLAAPTPQRQRLHAQGWLVCDGLALPIHDDHGRRTVYWPLYEIIGTLYGGDAAHFQLPDYRGYFFRGRDFDNGSGSYTPRDPDRATRTPSSPGQSATGVGSTQDSVVQNHGHDYTHLVTTPPSELVTQGEGPPGLATAQACATDYGAPQAWVGKTFAETRPINISINLLIKFTQRVGHPDPSLSRLLGLADVGPSLFGSQLLGSPFAGLHPPARPPPRRRRS